MFIDETRVRVTAGSGGDGCNSFYKDRFHGGRRGRPDGGFGGDGGDVIVSADSNIHTLLDIQYRQHVTAKSGTHGSSNHMKGHRGTDTTVLVPPGTLIKDFATGLVLRDLIKQGDSVIVAKGGAGGRGNSRGRESTKGAPGDDKELKLELKLMADVGIVGYPNAGKSTLISRISSARPKIADYPFTTKEPVLGVVRIYEGENLVVADIPGLIEGAHAGRGLGHKFLRHIERTKILIHLVDISGHDGRDPYSDYIKLNKELKLYNEELGVKPQIVALNKMDEPGSKKAVSAFRKRYGRKKLFAISAVTGDGIKELLSEVHKKCKNIKG
jgi:GTP-binding protein